MSVDRNSPFPAPPECTAALHWRKGKQAIVGRANSLVSRSCVAKTTLHERAAGRPKRCRGASGSSSLAPRQVDIIYIVAMNHRSAGAAARRRLRLDRRAERLFAEGVVDLRRLLDRLIEGPQLDERLFWSRLVERPADRALQACQAIGALERCEHRLWRGHQGERIDGFLGVFARLHGENSAVLGSATLGSRPRAKKLANGGMRCRPNSDKQCRGSSISMIRASCDNGLEGELKANLQDFRAGRLQETLELRGTVPGKSRAKFAVVASATRSSGSPFTSASLAATRGTFAGVLSLPRSGIGAR